MTESSAGAAPARAPILPTAVAAGFAAIVALIVHSPVLGNGFLVLDDPNYVTDNPVVRRGITLAGVRWAFNVGHAGNWHPLTWISHMADVSMFDMAPWGHHLTSWALHATSAALVTCFLAAVLSRGGVASADGSASVAVAAGLAGAIWAAHPWRVESVAWVAERKDVLSGVLALASLLAYVRFAERPSRPRFVTVTALLALGLAAKPMLVTLPALFLLLDRWPLARNEGLGRLVQEKIPWFVLASASCAVTVAAQRAAGALATMEAAPLGGRVSNAIVACAIYGRGLAWPGESAVLYPYPREGRSWPVVLAAAATLAVIAGGVVALRRRAPWLVTGSAWFLVALVPVIGIVQVGVQARADRYTYLPHLGLVLALAASALRSARSRGARLAWTLTAIVAIGVLGRSAWGYSGVWRDSETLLTRTISVTGDNDYAQFLLAQDLDQRAHFADGERHARAAVRLNPSLWPAWDELAYALAMQGRLEEGMDASRESLALRPEAATSRATLGTILVLQGKERERAGDRAGAVAAYERAIAVDPSAFDAWLGLGIVQVRAGNDAEAMRAIDAASRLMPQDARPYLWRAALALRRGDLDAARQAQRELASRSPEMAAAVEADIQAAVARSSGEKP